MLRFLIEVVIIMVVLLSSCNPATETDVNTVRTPPGPTATRAPAPRPSRVPPIGPPVVIPPTATTAPVVVPPTPVPPAPTPAPEKKKPAACQGPGSKGKGQERGQPPIIPIGLIERCS